MSIYSANRTGSMGTATLVANESYNSSDLGRILYESQCNDMAIFEAIVMSDLTERKALAEGTIVLAEAEEANKKSFKEIMEALKKRILAWFEKIKGAFKAAIRKISAYILGNNKAFVEDFKAKYAKRKGGSFDIDKSFEIVFYDDKALKDSIPSADEIKKTVEANRTADNVDKAEIIKTAYTKSLGGSGAADIKSGADYRAAAKEKYAEKVTVSEGSIERCIGILENASEAVKSLKALEEKIKTEVNKMVDILKKSEQEAKGVDGDKSHSQIIRNMTTTVGAFETVLTGMSATGLAFIKSNVKNARVSLRKILGAMVHESATFTEAAAEVDAAEADDVLVDTQIPVDPEVEKAVEEMEATVSAE